MQYNFCSALISMRNSVKFFMLQQSNKKDSRYKFVQFGSVQRDDYQFILMDKTVVF